MSSEDYGELFSVEHLEAYAAAYKASSIPISGLCFNNRFAWNMGRYYRFRLIEGLVCLYCEGAPGVTSRHLVLPLGDITPERLRRAVDFYYPAFEAAGDPVKIMYVPDGLLDMMNHLPGYRARIVNKPDFDEYVYEADLLRAFSGKLLKSKKNQMNRFYRECRGCTYDPLTPDDMADCLKLTEEWCLSRGIDRDDPTQSDYHPIRTIFEHFDRLDLRGGIIRLFRKAVAFSIGSPPICDTAFIHFEKADHVVAGANVAIISAVLQNEYPDVRFVNREEDMGIEGLRIAKQSYNPVFMTRKNDVFLSRAEEADA